MLILWNYFKYIWKIKTYI